MTTERSFSPTDLLSGQLDLLEKIASPVAYFRELADHPDEYIGVGAWAQRIASGSMSETEWPEVLKRCRYPIIRGLAVDFFEFAFEHGMALEAARTASTEPADLDREISIARLELDADRMSLHEARKFFLSGSTAHLILAAKTAESQGGWLAALPWLVRAFAINPRSQESALSLTMLLLQSDQFDLAKKLSERLVASRMHGELVLLIEGTVLLRARDFAGGIERLATVRPETIVNEHSRRGLSSFLQTQRAHALDGLGAFRKSFDEFSDLNRRNRSDQFAAKQHYDNVLRRKQLSIPTLPPDVRSDVTVMLGFPRSGTTLLENVLNAHPLIETFEEIPAHKAAIVYIYRKLGAGSAAGASALGVYEGARERYYAEIDRRRRKPTAVALVDKLPIQTGEAGFMKRLFPDRRYIFSIRHPFDVVLSCFRQQFAPNSAMENFRTISDAVRLYDFTMNEWFEVFDLSSPLVSYVRYEDLVTDFDPVVRRSIEFLDVGWNDDVQGFAMAADRRGYRTPSYEKVRKGLSIGVQSYWRNYGFVFDSPEARPLHKWAEFFGYPTS